MSTTRSLIKNSLDERERGQLVLSGKENIDRYNFLKIFNWKGYNHKVIGFLIIQIGFLIWIIKKAGDMLNANIDSLW
jgi:hypothetical protein